MKADGKFHQESDHNYMVLDSTTGPRTIISSVSATDGRLKRILEKAMETSSCVKVLLHDDKHMELMVTLGYVTCEGMSAPHTRVWVWNRSDAK